MALSSASSTPVQAAQLTRTWNSRPPRTLSIDPAPPRPTRRGERHQVERGPGLRMTRTTSCPSWPFGPTTPPSGAPLRLSPRARTLPAADCEAPSRIACHHSPVVEVPPHGAPEALLQIEVRPPPELATHPAGIDGVAAVVSRAVRDEFDEVRVRTVRAPGQQLVHPATDSPAPSRRSSSPHSTRRCRPRPALLSPGSIRGHERGPRRRASRGRSARPRRSDGLPLQGREDGDPEPSFSGIWQGP